MQKGQITEQSRKSTDEKIRRSNWKHNIKNSGKKQNENIKFISHENFLEQSKAFNTQERRNESIVCKRLAEWGETQCWWGLGRNRNNLHDGCSRRVFFWKGQPQKKKEIAKTGEWRTAENLCKISSSCSEDVAAQTVTEKKNLPEVPFLGSSDKRLSCEKQENCRPRVCVYVDLWIDIFCCRCEK